MQRGISWRWWPAWGRRRWLFWTELLSPPRSLFLRKGDEREISYCCALSVTLISHFNTCAHTHTYERAPEVGWCFRWGRGDSPDLWSRASALQRQSPGHISVQPVGPLLQGKPTAHCPTLLMLTGGGGRHSVRMHTSHRNTHKNTQAYLAQRRPSGCWPPSETPAPWISLHGGDLMRQTDY